jgi:hypothetical protein
MWGVEVSEYLGLEFIRGAATGTLETRNVGWQPQDSVTRGAFKLFLTHLWRNLLRVSVIGCGETNSFQTNLSAVLRGQTGLGRWFSVCFGLFGRFLFKKKIDT